MISASPFPGIPDASILGRAPRPAAAAAGAATSKVGTFEVVRREREAGPKGDAQGKITGREE
jgi:hypothetical protein